MCWQWRACAYTLYPSSPFACLSPELPHLLSYIFSGYDPDWLRSLITKECRFLLTFLSFLCELRMITSLYTSIREIRYPLVYSIYIFPPKSLSSIVTFIAGMCITDCSLYLNHNSNKQCTPNSNPLPELIVHNSNCVWPEISKLHRLIDIDFNVYLSLKIAVHFKTLRVSRECVACMPGRLHISSIEAYSVSQALTVVNRRRARNKITVENEEITSTTQETMIIISKKKMFVFFILYS